MNEDLVERAESDPQRPRYHFTAPGGWLNDPNGLGQWQGTYHLFYQYNPHAAVHGRIHWGHATSQDLVTWNDEPVALVPSDDGPDRDGCWSGVLVDDQGTPTLVYSGNRDGRQLPCVATGSADLRTWVTDPGNPVIDHPPPGLDVTGFRDHCVWRESGHWRQLVGSGVTGVGGTALLYDSDDLREWRLVGTLLVGDTNERDRTDDYWTGDMWECVDLFRPPSLEPGGPASDVLVLSACDDVSLHHALYLTGTYAGDHFDPVALERLDLGGSCFYAPQSFTDEGGRRVMFGWLQEERPEASSVAAGWAGALSVPREVTLGVDGALWQAPVREVASLRSEPVVGAVGVLDQGRRIALGSGVAVDVELVVRLEPGAVVEVAVRATPDDEERTVIRLARGTADDAGQVRLELDRSRSTLDPAVEALERQGLVPVGLDGSVALRVLVDHSALEVFANGRALASRTYPTRDDALGVQLVLTSGSAVLDSATTWVMRDIWSGPRTLWPSVDG
ncbi:glycosyl hydrolase family 32 [Humibacillus sp. DSM 29435]|uniref:glycoside hydrolase family 32 protein n=1 Tax=Humibacillus sp. DSM 29435 TaxID=1869167 RepID=UPI0008728E9C|nr:glycoside hydrolase family 32 protein [Humibacillus sp. DSM 29435]OFE15022.1 glycosyl hydrolase family 32 [Humibacillus sp. DSM 29435]